MELLNQLNQASSEGINGQYRKETLVTSSSILIRPLGFLFYCVPSDR